MSKPSWRSKKIRILGPAALGIVVAAAVGGCGASQRQSGPYNPLEDSSLQDWVHQCNHSLDNWRKAQIDWPSSVKLSLGQSETYHAVADAWSVPLQPNAYIPDTDTDTGTVVECVLGARLTSVDDGLEVQDVAPDQGGWRYKKFDARGRIDWTWTVTARGLGQHELKLEMQPIAQAPMGTDDFDLSSSLQESSRVEVTGDFIQHAAFWFKDEGGYITTIAAALLAGLLWLLQATGRLSGAWRQLYSKPQGPAQPGTPLGPVAPSTTDSSSPLPPYPRTGTSDPGVAKNPGASGRRRR